MDVDHDEVEVNEVSGQDMVNMDEADEDGYIDVEEAPVVGFAEHGEAVFCVDMANGIACTGGADDTAYLWRVADAEPLAKLNGHTDSVIDVKFNFNGSLVATAGMDGVVKIWNASSGDHLKDLDGPSGELEFVSWHPKGNVVLAGSADGTCWMWDAAKGFMQCFIGHQGPVRAGGFGYGGKVVVTAGSDGKLYVFDPKSAMVKGTVEIGSPATCLSLKGGLAVSGAEGGEVWVSGVGKSIRPLVQLATGEFSTSVEAVAMSENEKMVVSGGLDGGVIVSDVETGRTRVKCMHDAGVVKLLWDPRSENLVYSASMDKTVKVWDVRNGELVQTWRGHSQGILDMAISTDSSGETFMTTAADDNISFVYKLK